MSATEGAPARTVPRLSVGLLPTLVYLLYAPALYLAYTRLSGRGVGLVLLALYLATILARRQKGAGDLWRLVSPYIGLVGLVVVAIAIDNKTILLLLPALVTFYFFAMFTATLFSGPPMIERFARLIEDDLPPFALPYCRRATVLWCVFLAANAATIAALAFAPDLKWWTLYTGFVSYLLMGILFGTEVCFRKWWFRHYQDGLLDRVFSRLFPAERTARGRRSLEYAARRATL